MPSHSNRMMRNVNTSRGVRRANRRGVNRLTNLPAGNQRGLRRARVVRPNIVTTRGRTTSPINRSRIFSSSFRNGLGNLGYSRINQFGKNL